MSDQPSRVTQRHFDYIAERTAGDDAFLKQLKSAAVEAGIPAIQVNPAQASLMQILLRLRGAEHVVEVGTLAGYSAIAMARAGCRVTTIELEPRYAGFAREWIAQSDVADRIEVREGAGADVLPTLPDASADACFLDADKASYRRYLEECRRILRPGALVMADNAFAFGQLFEDQPTDREAPAMKAFNDTMARQDWIQSVIVPMGDGLWVGVALA